MIFLACDALGIEGSVVRGFRGPGRFTPGVDVVVGTSGLVSTAGGGAGLSPLPSPCSFSEEEDAEADSDVGRGCGCGCGDQRGHFFASSESSGTSTTSLEGKKVPKREVVHERQRQREHGRVGRGGVDMPLPYQCSVTVRNGAPNDSCVSVALCDTRRKEEKKDARYVRDVLSRKQVRLFDLDTFHLGWRLGGWWIGRRRRRQRCGHGRLKAGPKCIALSTKIPKSAHARIATGENVTSFARQGLSRAAQSR